LIYEEVRVHFSTSYRKYVTSLMLQQKDTMSLLVAVSFAIILVARYLRGGRKSFADASRRWYRPFLQDEREYP